MRYFKDFATLSCRPEARTHFGNTGLWPVRPAEFYSAVPQMKVACYSDGTAGSKPAGRTGFKPVFLCGLARPSFAER